VINCRVILTQYSFRRTNFLIVRRLD
jgi:hypothetical protein